MVTSEKVLGVSEFHPALCVRQAGDAISTRKVCVAVVQSCFEKRDFKALNEHILLLSKRRSQLKQVLYGPP